MIAPADLRRRLKAGDELAFLDLREEGPFSRAQPLFAVNLPLSRLELDVARLVPRRGVPVALFDDGEGLAERGRRVLGNLGYTDVDVVAGGLAAWQAAGGEVFRDVNVPSKAFGEWVEHHCHTPMIDALALKRLLDSGGDVVVLDSRPFNEYRAMTIPTSVDCPGAELVLRARGAAPSPDTLVVVNCAGRTRSIIGAQSLINAGLPNPVKALENGTIGWHLAGLELELGACRRAPPPSSADLAWARTVAADVARRTGVRTIDAAQLARFEAEDVSLFRFDVRSPEEYIAGHATTFASAPGGQLVQATDEFVGIRGARLVLADDDGVRAAMTASWLRQLGWDHVFVLDGGLAGRIDAVGPAAPEPRLSLPGLAVDEVAALLAKGVAQVVDLARSPAYLAGHIPGAWFAIRSRFAQDLGALPPSELLILTSPDGRLGANAVADAAEATGRDIVGSLAGGTQAWVASGRSLEAGPTRLASPPDDIYRRPYEGTDNSDAAMRAYIDWELELVAQIRRDGTANFRPLPCSR